MMRHAGILTATVLLLLQGEAAVAQDGAMDTCRRAATAELRIAACSQVIASAQASTEEKAQAFRNRGSVRAAAGANDEAIADLGEAIRLAPADHQSYIYRGQVLLARGNAEAAVADYGEAIRLRPGQAIGYVGRGHAQLVRGRNEAAIADFTTAIRLNPASASAHNNRGLAYKAAGDLARAIEDYTTAVTLNPIYALAYNNRGYAYEAQGRTAQAIADFRAALLLDPSLVGATAGLSRLGALGTLSAESARLVADGKVIAQRHCRQCHAVADEGWSPNPKAPPFRNLHHRHPLQTLREPLARGIAAPHDEMPKFKLTDADVDKIVAYINSLAPRR